MGSCGPVGRRRRWGHMRLLLLLLTVAGLGCCAAAPSLTCEQFTRSACEGAPELGFKLAIDACYSKAEVRQRALLQPQDQPPVELEMREAPKRRNVHTLMSRGGTDGAALVPPRCVRLDGWTGFSLARGAGGTEGFEEGAGALVSGVVTELWPVGSTGAIDARARRCAFGAAVRALLQLVVRGGGRSGGADTVRR